ncbi:MAG: YybH family protein [Deltaproteobacteria bacterium]
MKKTGVIGILSVLISLFCSLPVGGQALAILEKGGGLNIATFETPHGRIKLYLPDEVIAGDTVSAAAEILPVGLTQIETDKNRAELLLYSIEFAAQSRKLAAKTLKWTIPPNSLSPALILRDKSSKQVASVRISAGVGGVAAPEPRDYQFPPVGQAGMPAQIVGSFDGDFATTRLSIGGRDVKILAESPRKLVFESPLSGIGQSEMALTESGVSISRPFRNLRVVRFGESRVEALPQIPLPEIAPQKRVETPLQDAPADPPPANIAPPAEINILKEREVLPPPIAETPAPSVSDGETTNLESKIDESLVADSTVLFPLPYPSASAKVDDAPLPLESPASDGGDLSLGKSDTTDIAESDPQSVSEPAAAKEEGGKPTELGAESEPQEFIIELPEEMHSAQNQDAIAEVDNPPQIIAQKSEAAESLAPSLPDEDSVERFIEQFAAVRRGGDFEGFISLFDPSAQGGADVIRDYSEKFYAFEVVEYRIQALRVDIVGGTALVDGNFTMVERDRDTSRLVESSGKISWILIWRGNLWKIEELASRASNP